MAGGGKGSPARRDVAGAVRRSAAHMHRELLCARERPNHPVLVVPLCQAVEEVSAALAWLRLLTAGRLNVLAWPKSCCHDLASPAESQCAVAIKVTLPLEGVGLLVEVLS